MEEPCLQSVCQSTPMCFKDANRSQISEQSFCPSLDQQSTDFYSLLQNLPALPAGSSKKRADDGASEQEGQIQLGSLLVVTKQGVVQGYSKTQVKVVFTPAVQGPVREQISIAFRCVCCSKMHTGMAQHCGDAAAVWQLPDGCIAMQITTADLLHQSTPHGTMLAECRRAFQDVD